MTDPRPRDNHPATFQVWFWLDGPDGRALPQEKRERIVDVLRDLDAHMLRLDREAQRVRA